MPNRLKNASELRLLTLLTQPLHTQPMFSCFQYNIEDRLSVQVRSNSPLKDQGGVMVRFAICVYITIVRSAFHILFLCLFVF